MIKEKEILVSISRKNITYYKELGYDVKGVYTELLAKVDDINHNSHLNITAVCDVCGAEASIRIHKYYENKERGGYYGCKKCSRIKFKETCMEKYGVDNPLKSEEIKDKVESTNMDRYGVKTTLLETNTKEKIDKTKMERYGTTEVLSCQEVRDKSKETYMEKYGVDHYSKSQNFKDDVSVRWENYSKEKLEKYGITNYILKSDDRTIDIWCDKCQAYYNITSKNLYQRTDVQLLENICTICNPLSYSVSGEDIELLDFIKENYDGEVVVSDRNLIKSDDVYIYLPGAKLAIEFNGIYLHSDRHKHKMYHIEKTNSCDLAGVKLIHVWEDDWLFRRDIVKSVILNRLHKSNIKIHARKCDIRKVCNDECREFLESNHIQGFVGSAIKYGLYHDGVLVSLMTFGKPRKIMGSEHEDGKFELLRFCSKLGTNVVGAPARLFQHFLKNNVVDEMVSFADRSYFTGGMYESLGFVLDGVTEPGYSYFNTSINKFHRFNFRKDALVKMGYDENKTEFEIMDELGYHRVYNCGNMRYIYQKIKQPIQ